MTYLPEFYETLSSRILRRCCGDYRDQKFATKYEQTLADLSLYRALTFHGAVVSPLEPLELRLP